MDDSASAFIRTDEGTTISLEVAWATNRPTNDEFFLRGTEGGVGSTAQTRRSHCLETADTAGCTTERPTSRHSG